MNLRSILTFLRTPNLLPLLRVMRDWQSFVRLHYLYTALESGLLEALKTPTSRDELVRKLDVQRPELLGALLDLGVSVGELLYKKDLYSIKGSYSRALTRDDGDVLAAVIQETAGYYGSVHQHTTARLYGAPLGDYLDEFAEAVARFSKLTEPFVGEFIRDVIAGKEPARFLDVGCGSGVYLRAAAQANPQATGVGIDLDDKVVAQARQNLERWGIGDRFKVVVGDVQSSLPDLAGPFDLIALINVVYYFPVDQRPALFRSLRSMLSSDGVLAVVSSMQSNGSSVWAANLDLVTRSTVGCASLPELNELTQHLRQSGFSQIKKTRLMPGDAFYGIVAR